MMVKILPLGRTIMLFRSAWSIIQKWFLTWSIKYTTSILDTKYILHINLGGDLHNKLNVSRILSASISTNDGSWLIVVVLAVVLDVLSDGEFLR